jgi:hypothetical protein
MEGRASGVDPLSGKAFGGSNIGMSAGIPPIPAALSWLARAPPGPGRAWEGLMYHSPNDGSIAR